VGSSDEPNPKSNQVLVTASFGRILRKRQLELFSPGRRLNVHPSLLPHYRGPAPIQHALLNDEKETGVCVIEMLKMKAGPVDSGDIWGSEKTVRETDLLHSPSLWVG
jgi:methionyl-tRNA formyltransferase